MDYERREDRRRAAHYILNYRQEREAYEAGRAQKNFDEMGFILFILSAIICGQRFSDNNKEDDEG